MQTYTFRLQVANKTNVTGEVRDGTGALLENPTGKFGFSGARRTQTLALVTKLRSEQPGAAAKPTAAELRKLGDLLFQALFNDQIYSRFFENYKTARREQALLRVELEVDEHALPPEIAALPWEFLHVDSIHGHGDFWLATNPVLVFSRQRARLNLPKPLALETGEKLRVALAVAAPQGKSTPYEEFWSELQALADQEKERLELLPLVNPATTHAIDDLLERKPHVLHFIGHGDLALEGRDEQGFIHLVDETGYALSLTGYEFAELFVRHRPGIVVLHVCEGGALSAAEAFAGVASQVVEQDIPVVIAMQYPVSNATARRFGREFYQRLAQDEPVDKAVQEGRLAVARSATGYQKRDFATPVLFMRVQDATVFKRPPVAHPRPNSGGGGGGGGPWDWVITITQYTSALRNTLAGLYPTQADVTRLARDASLDPRRLRDDPNPTNRMMFLLDEARNQGQLGAVVKQALDDNAANSELQQALQALQGQQPLRGQGPAGGSPETGKTPGGGETQPIPRPPEEWGIHERGQVVTALLACPSMADRDKRDTVVAMLPVEIRDNIARSDASKYDVQAILKTCLDYRDGLARLLEAIEFLDGRTLAFQKLKDKLNELKAPIEP